VLQLSQIQKKFTEGKAKKSIVIFAFCSHTEAYHLEAINSDPMLGFFREKVSIAGKHFFFVSEQVCKSCCVENIIC